MKMTFVKNSAFALMLVLPCLFVLQVGCGGSEGGPYYSTKGKVTLDGNPLKSATIEFMPDLNTSGDKPARGAIGFTNDQGSYVMLVRETEGCLPGEYIVSISTYAEPAGDGGGVEGVEEEQATPEKVHPSYKGRNSKLKAKVTSDGENVFNFDLKSDGS
ncbi:MAG: hypothetical protein MK108_11965 [Mariniblastus sp.]|nr:hypothetical protein [Mariniblastus sp.]